MLVLLRSWQLRCSKVRLQGSEKPDESMLTNLLHSFKVTRSGPEWESGVLPSFNNGALQYSSKYQ